MYVYRGTLGLKIERKLKWKTNGRLLYKKLHVIPARAANYLQHSVNLSAPPCGTRSTFRPTTTHNIGLSSILWLGPFP